MSRIGVSHEPIVTLEDKVYLETYLSQTNQCTNWWTPTKVKVQELRIVC